MTIRDPCENLLITAPATTPTVDDYRYTGQEISFTFDEFTISTAGCPVTYTCETVSDASIDLCSISWSLTNSDFDSATRTWTFSSFDPIELPEG